MMFRILFFVTLLSSVSYGCNSKKAMQYSKVNKGLLVAAEVSHFQYGSHWLVKSNGDIIVALKSTTIDLDKYLNQSVEVRGNYLDSYPLSGGPEYMSVLEVIKLKE